VDTEADFGICGTATEIQMTCRLLQCTADTGKSLAEMLTFADNPMITTVSNLQDNIFQWNVTNGFCTETAQLTVTRLPVIPAAHANQTPAIQ